MLDLFNNQYDLNILKKNIYALNLVDIIKTQKLDADFVLLRRGQFRTPDGREQKPRKFRRRYTHSKQAMRRFMVDVVWSLNDDIHWNLLEQRHLLCVQIVFDP